MQLLYETKLSNAAHRHSWSEILFTEIIPSFLELKKKKCKIAWSQESQVKGGGGLPA